MSSSYYCVRFAHLANQSEYTAAADCEVIIGDTRLPCHSEALSKYSSKLRRVFKTMSKELWSNRLRELFLRFDLLRCGFNVDAVEFFLACCYKLDDFDKLVNHYGRDLISWVEDMSVGLNAPEIKEACERYRKSRDVKTASCPVCLDTSDVRQMKKTPCCKQLTHGECWDRCLLFDPRCPLCRQSVSTSRTRQPIRRSNSATELGLPHRLPVLRRDWQEQHSHQDNRNGIVTALAVIGVFLMF